jgi:hypothetical protein
VVQIINVLPTEFSQQVLQVLEHLYWLQRKRLGNSAKGSHPGNLNIVVEEQESDEIDHRQPSTYSYQAAHSL